MRRNVQYLHTVVQQWWASDGPSHMLTVNGQTIALTIGKDPDINCCLYFFVKVLKNEVTIKKKQKLMPSSGLCGDYPAFTLEKQSSDFQISFKPDAV